MRAPILVFLASAFLAGCGDDRPAMVPAAGSADAPERLGEPAKIERLIAHIENLPGASFIRNGTKYDAAEAAKHLRTKLRFAGSKITTARQFIDELATRSSQSGEPYRIVLHDGRSVAAGEYFHERLAELEGEF